jgi:hypothetical protein
MARNGTWPGLHFLLLVMKRATLKFASWDGRMGAAELGKRKGPGPAYSIWVGSGLQLDELVKIQDEQETTV